MPMAAFALMVDTKPGKMLYASRGIVKPTIRAPTAYDNGISHALTAELRKLATMCLLNVTQMWPCVRVGPSERQARSACRTLGAVRYAFGRRVLRELLAADERGWIAYMKTRDF